MTRIALPLLIPAEYSVVFGHSKCLARAGAARCAPTLYFANINKRAAAGWQTKTKAAQINAAALLVGPEGGWTDAEREAARRAGYRPASLGNLILRSETAAVAAVGVLAHLLEA